MRSRNFLSPSEMQQYFIKWKDGRLTASEQKRLQDWLASSPEHQREWERLVALWNLAATPVPASARPAEVLWEDLAPQLQTRPAALPKTRLFFIRERVEELFAWLRPLPKWAYVAAAILVAGVLFKLNSPRHQLEWMTLAVPAGQRTTVLLPDSASVEINAGSIFKYPKKFAANERRVELAGEAFFQVRRNNTPFKVETAHATTQVLGTAFNIRTWNQVTRVFVQSGKVALQSKSAPAAEKLVLSAGQMADCDSVAIRLAAVEHPEDIIAWREGRLVFRRQFLAEVIRELTRHFATRIEADSSLLRHTITADFSQESLAQIMEALAASVKARYEKSGNGYRLLPK